MSAISTLTTNTTITRISTTTTTTTNTLSIDTRQKRRRTCAQVMGDNEQNTRVTKHEEGGFSYASKQWRTEVKKRKGKQISPAQLVATINKERGTSICKHTIRARVHMDCRHTAPKMGGKGRKPVTAIETEVALSNVLSIYIKRCTVRMKRKPKQKDLIKKLDLCMSAGGSKISSFHNFFRQITKKISTAIEVSKGSTRMEQRRIEWTTHRNIMKWFDTLREKLITLGFSQIATEYNKTCGVTGEIAFIEGQTYRILNLDESEVSLDGTSKHSGGRPDTEYASTNSNIPKE